MITTHWPQRAPQPVTDLTVWWTATPRTAADLTRLRRELRALVRHGPWRAGGDADVDRLLLVFEELASNGLRHGRPPVNVLVAKVLTGWLLDVSDAAVELPPAPARDRDAADGGMGLPLVARLSGAHGWTAHGERKHVWARIDAATLPDPADDAVLPPHQPAEPAGGGAPDLARVHGVIDDRATVLGWPPELRSTDPLPEPPSDVVTDLLAVRGEALTNIARHARAGSVHVDVVVTDDDLTLCERDNGTALADTPRNGDLDDLRHPTRGHRADPRHPRGRLGKVAPTTAGSGRPGRGRRSPRHRARAWFGTAEQRVRSDTVPPTEGASCPLCVPRLALPTPSWRGRP